MRYDNLAYAVETFGTDTAKEMTIAASGKAFHTLISGLYSNKIQSIVRESCANAWDAHVAAGTTDQPFIVHSPNRWEPWYSVRDFGVSMSHEFVIELYSTLFRSTKEDTNDMVGSFGLGSKAPFSYTNEFTLKCWLDGIERIYTCAIADGGRPQIIPHGPGIPSDEPTGVEVSFPVKTPDISEFEQAIQRAAVPYAVPFKCNIEVEVATYHYTHPQYNILNVNTALLRRLEGPFVEVGPVWYKIDTKEPGLVEALGSSRADAFGRCTDIVLRAPIGSVEVTPSRENLSYSKRTIENIAKLMTASYGYFEERVQAYLEGVTTVWEATQRMHAFAGGYIEHLILKNMESPWGRYGDLKSKDTIKALTENTYRYDVTKGMLKCQKKGGLERRGMLDRNDCVPILLLDPKEDDSRFFRSKLLNLHTSTDWHPYGLVISLPDPDQVKRMSLSASMVKPSDPKALHQHKKDLRIKLGGMYQQAVRERRDILTWLEEFGSPHVFRLADLPEPPKKVKEKRDPSLKLYTRAGSGRFTTEFDLAPEVDDHFLLVPTKRGTPDVQDLDGSMLLAINHYSDESFLRIVGVSSNNYAKALKDDRFVALDEAVKRLDAAKVKSDYAACRLHKAKADNRLDTKTIKAYRIVIDHLADAAPADFAQALAINDDIRRKEIASNHEWNRNPVRHFQGSLKSLYRMITGSVLESIDEPVINPAQARIENRYPYLLNISPTYSHGDPGQYEREAHGAYVLGIEAMHNAVAVTMLQDQFDIPDTDCYSSDNSSTQQEGA
jgi:hypothetical protein